MRKEIILLAGLAMSSFACNSHEQMSDADKKTDATRPPVTTMPVAGQGMHSLMQQNMQQMMAVASTGNADRDFATMMKIHHQGAIDMAQLELKEGRDEYAKQFAQKIINDQQKEIGEFEQILQQLDSTGKKDQFHANMMASMHAMHNMDSVSGPVDQQFMAMMIPHHEEAVEMVNIYLRSGAQNPRLRTMAQQIVREQQKEIQEMRSWLAKSKVKIKK